MIIGRKVGIPKILHRINFKGVQIGVRLLYPYFPLNGLKINYMNDLFSVIIHSF